MLDLFEESWRDVWAGAEQMEAVGAIFTKPAIVELILDLAGYAPQKGRLAQRRVLEPSCGDGAFTKAIVTRMLGAEARYVDPIRWDDPVLDGALRAADINEASIATARSALVEQLRKAGCPSSRALQLAELWVVHTDFLLADWVHRFDLVVGNPPYVRIEQLPKAVLERYRTIFETSKDRADLYVAFIEKGLQLLSASGCLAFICANRWTKNQYGAELRRLVARSFHVRYYLNLEHTQPFEAEVSAYPAIFVIDRAQGSPTRAATLDNLDSTSLETTRRALSKRSRSDSLVSEFKTWYPEGGPWVTTCSAEHDALAELRTLPLLEDSAPGTKVGIGVATGADRIFVLKQQHPHIESSRQIPLLMAANISSQQIAWSGRYLLNPFSDADDGSLVELSEHPGLKLYLETYARELKQRHVAKTRPNSWYRTIDRIWPALQHKPKLVIPDIQAGGVVGYDEGHYYPHHNVYWIVSDTWNLRALQALLRSSYVLRQVRAYSVQMRGGSVRYQAQTLRRIRVPAASKLNSRLIEELAEVSSSTNQGQIDGVAGRAFNGQ